MAWPTDLTRTKDWGTEIMTDTDLEGQLDLIIAWVMAMMNLTTGHKHDATENEGPKITSAGIADDNILFDALDDDGDYGPFTGDWSFNEIALVEDTAPATAVGEGKIYTKDAGGQPEAFFREESNGDEVQITSCGALHGVTPGDAQVKGWINFNGTGVIAERDSYNVAGIVDNGVGDYTITWDTDFANTNYVCVSGLGETSGYIARFKTFAVGSVKVYIVDNAFNNIDEAIICVMAIGDQ